MEVEISGMLTSAAICQKVDLGRYKTAKHYADMLKVLDHRRADGTGCSSMGTLKYERDVLGIHAVQKKPRASASRRRSSKMPRAGELMRGSMHA